MPQHPDTATSSSVNWKSILLFVGLAFGFAYAIDIVITVTGGLNTMQARPLIMLRMFTPGLAAFFWCVGSLHTSDGLM